MKTWVRFQQGDAVKFGTLEGDTISVYNGNMFDNPQPTGESVKLADVTLFSQQDDSVVEQLFCPLEQTWSRHS